MRKSILFILFLLIGSVQADETAGTSLADTTFSLHQQMKLNLSGCDDLLAGCNVASAVAPKLAEDEDESATYYFNTLYGEKSRYENQKGPRGERILALAKSLRYPIRSGLAADDTGSESYASFTDTQHTQLRWEQHSTFSRLSTFGKAFGDVLYDLISSTERRRQMGEHAIAWKHDENGKMFRLSPVESLREDVQSLNYIVANNLDASMDNLLITDSSKLAISAILALTQQRGAAWMILMKMQQDKDTKTEETSP